MTACADMQSWLDLQSFAFHSYSISTLGKKKEKKTMAERSLMCSGRTRPMVGSHKVFCTLFVIFCIKIRLRHFGISNSPERLHRHWRHWVPSVQLLLSPSRWFKAACLTSVTVSFIGWSVQAHMGSIKFSLCEPSVSPLCRKIPQKLQFSMS